MSRLTVNLEKYKDLIVNHFQQSYDRNDIARLLENEHQIKITERTIQRKLTE